MVANPSHHLLLLPNTSWSGSGSPLSATIRNSITKVLKELSSEVEKSLSGVKLDIALPWSYLFENRSKPRRALYSQAQILVSAIYKFICVVAAKEKINVEDAEGVDARVILIAYSGDEGSGSAQSELSTSRLGPVINLRTLSASQRPWDLVFGVDTELGNQILDRFVILQDRRLKIRKVQVEDDDMIDDISPPTRWNDDSARQDHSSIALGGTFDHIHIGHKLLLTMFAFLLGADSHEAAAESSLTIGVTGDELLKNKKYAEVLESWEARQASTAAFLQSIMDFRPEAESTISSKDISEPGSSRKLIYTKLGAGPMLKFAEIGDPFGPTITDEAISALVISAETRSGGKAVNDKRTEKGWTELEVFEVDVLDAEEDADKSVDDGFQSKLSSTRIRQNLSRKQTTNLQDKF